MKEMDTKKSRRTDTTIFILPLMFAREDIIIPGFENAFIKNDILYDRDTVVLQYRNENKHLSKYSPIRIIRENDKWYYFFDTTSLLDEITTILDGKYGYLLATSKARILSFWNLGRQSKMYSVLYPIKPINVMSDKHIWPKPNLQNESIIIRGF